MTKILFPLHEALHVDDVVLMYKKYNVRSEGRTHDLRIATRDE